MASWGPPGVDLVTHAFGQRANSTDPSPCRATRLPHSLNLLRPTQPYFSPTAALQPWSSWTSASLGGGAYNRSPIDTEGSLQLRKMVKTNSYK